MGLPAQDYFPAKLFARIRARAVRAEASAAANHSDPCGEPELRREIAAHLAIARGVVCSPSQIIVTSGFTGGLGLTLRVLGLEGRRAWIEDPGFPLTRRGLEIAKLTLTPIPVDANGIDVDHGVQVAPDAAVAVVTPGQQAPLGSTLSRARRIRLLDWAAQTGAWIIEDDYLSELQLKGRAAPALASLDRVGRVIHVGSFSKTISGGSPKLHGCGTATWRVVVGDRQSGGADGGTAGVRLLHRSTRSITLTVEGARFLERCRRIFFRDRSGRA
jgi:GntR family transcriptional regulator / MocR family aminotransferase